MADAEAALRQAAFADELVRDSFAYMEEAAKKRGITQVKFSKVIRHLSFAHNLFEEMTLFSKINTSSSGVISFEEWSDAVLNRIDARLPNYAQKLQLMYLEAHPELQHNEDLAGVVGGIKVAAAVGKHKQAARAGTGRCTAPLHSHIPPMHLSHGRSCFF